MSFELDLAGRRALVTGGTKGVGAAVVETLAKAGVAVVAAARSLPERPVPGVRYVAADLTSSEGCAKVADATLSQLGGIDIAVNSVGGSSAPAGGFAALDDAQWTKELAHNLFPAVRLDRALLPSMLAQGKGVIIHVTSIQHMLPLPESTIAYAAAKAALALLARQGQPGGIDVDAAPDGGEAGAEALTLLGRAHMGEQDESEIRPVMLDDQDEVLQLRVIVGADDFQIAEQSIEAVGRYIAEREPDRWWTTHEVASLSWDERWNARGDRHDALH